jgi:hypothetical protein
MKELFFTSLLIIVVAFCYGQTEPFFSAGPDITICSGTGKEIGHPTVSPLSKYCYRWAPATGLSNPDDAKPIANPKQTTTYTLTVLSENWDLIGTDQVTVHVGWGGIKFDPTYLFQSGSSMVTPTLTINNFGGLPHWTIEGPKLDCQMPNPSTGIITDGNKFGKITVRCEDILQPTGECYAEETLEINPGVKDVQAFDFNNPERMAKNGETLTLIDDYSARIKAVPNEGGFPSGYPKWYPSINSPLTTTVPTDGETIFVRSESFDEEFIAGPSPENSPRVYINRKAANETNIDLSPILNSVSSIMEALTDNMEFALGGCGSLEVALSASNLNYKKATVEKYADPGEDYKHEFVFAPNISLTGKACHCALTQCLEWPFTNEKLFGSELCLIGAITVGLQGSAAKDPSKADASWTFLEEFKFVSELEFGVVGGVELPVGGSFTVEGSISLTIKPAAELSFETATAIVGAQFKVNPLVLRVAFTVNNSLDPAESYTFFDDSYNMIPEWSSPKYPIFTFGND